MRTSRISGVFIAILSGKFYEIVCLVLKFFSLFCISPESSRVRRRPRNNTSFRRSSKSITRYILLRKTQRVLRVIYTKCIYVFRTKCFKFDDIFTSTRKQSCFRWIKIWLTFWLANIYSIITINY